MKVLSITPNKLQTITPQNFRDLAVDFKVTLPEEFLYEKSKTPQQAVGHQICNEAKLRGI